MLDRHEHAGQDESGQPERHHDAQSASSCHRAERTRVARFVVGELARVVVGHGRSSVARGVRGGGLASRRGAGAETGRAACSDGSGSRAPPRSASRRCWGPACSSSGRPATAAAGSAVLVALPLAAAIAALNAASTTRLAMRHPVSGGAYAYGRAELGPMAGFSAGFLFLLGKTASVAAIALVGGSYLWPGSERPVAVALVVVLAALNATGVRSTAIVSAVAAAVVIVVLVAVLGVSLPGADVARLAGDARPLGVLPAAGLIFFAFAGYARVATLGEEVRDPVRVLPRAVLLAVAVVFVLSAATLARAAGGSRRRGAGRGHGAGGRAGASRLGARAAGGRRCRLRRIARRGARRAESHRPGDGAGRRAAVRAGAHRPTHGDAGRLRRLRRGRRGGRRCCCSSRCTSSASRRARCSGTTRSRTWRRSARAGELGLARGIPIAGLAGCLLVAATTSWPALLGVAVALAVALGVRALVRTGARRVT